MAFDMNGYGTRVALDGADECIISELPRQFGLVTPQCDFLWEAFYRSPQLNSPEQVQLFRNEVIQIRDAYERHRKQILQRERKVHARDPARLDEILNMLLVGDPILAKCEELVRLCNDAISGGDGIHCTSD